MAKFKNIKIKMKGGKSRIQRVMVLASGKFRFVKNKRKSDRVPTKKRTKSNKKRRKSQPIRTTSKRSPSVAKKRFARARKGFTSITKNKFVRGAVLGLGGGAIALQVSNRFFPQANSIAQPLGAFVFGGPIGLVASVLLQGGLSFLGGGGNGDTTNARDSL